MSPDAAAAPRRALAEDDPGDSVDLILGEWSGQRPDLELSALDDHLEVRAGELEAGEHRLHAHLQAGLQPVFARFELTGADFQVIVHLRRAGAPYRMSQTRLMSQLALTSGTVSLRVDRLVRRGIVVREPDPDDHRSQLVQLTSEGLRLFDEVAPAHLANEDRLLSALTPAERAT